MESGRLNRRITLQSVSESADESGQMTETWSDVATVWAEVVQAGGREFFQGGKQPEADAAFRIRYLSGITRKHRITYNGETYDITAIKELGYRDGLELIARALVT